MSVQLDPAELGFRRPFNQEVTQLLRLRNPASEPIAFKVKTTAPKQYCVRPNSGRIEAGMEVEVQVLLQAMKEEPPLDVRCRDKFLVQSVAITPEREMPNIQNIWSMVEKTAKSEIQERKIRVVFLSQEGSQRTGEALTPGGARNINGAYERDDAPPAYGSPSTSFGSPAPNAAISPANPKSESIKQETPSSNTGAIGGALSSAAQAIPTNQEQLQEQLSKANATIASLKQQAEEQVLRQRKSDAVNQDSKERITTGTTGMGVQQQPADGVPVQIVAALCLLSFLLAYFFF